MNVQEFVPVWSQVPVVKLPVKDAPLENAIVRFPPEPNVALFIMLPLVIAPVVKLTVPTVELGMYGVSPETPVIVEPVRLRVPVVWPVDVKLPSMFVTDCATKEAVTAQ